MNTYIAVRGARSRREFIAYLYDKNKIVGDLITADNGRVSGVVHCPTEDAAQYQADRYASGMIGASLHPTATEAGESLL